MNETMQTILHRRAIRRFDARQIEEELLQQILQAGAVAAENMMLAADSLGIGSCYIGQGWTAFADSCGQEILRKWEIHTDYYAVMQLLLGYPKADDRHPAAKARKEDRILRF